MLCAKHKTVAKCKCRLPTKRLADSSRTDTFEGKQNKHFGNFVVPVALSVKSTGTQNAEVGVVGSNPPWRKF